MSELNLKRHNRRTFLKYAGTSALALSLAQGPWVHAQGPILIGMANPLSTFFGEAAEKALRLGISQINASGGMLGRPLDLIVSDSAGRADQSLLAVQDLAARGAQFLTGIFFSEELLGAIPAFPIVRKIFLGTGASTPAATIQVNSDYNNYKFFFRVNPINSILILQAVVIFVRGFLEAGLKWNSMVVFAEDAAWNKTITDGLPRILASVGSKITIADTIRYAEDTTDFTSLYSRAENAMRGKTGGIFTVMAHTGTRPTAQWAAQRVALPYVGINVQAQDGRFDELTQGAAESVVTLTTGAKAPITEKTIPFVEAFESFDFKREITTPSYNAYGSYDALFMLKEAVEAAGVLPNNEANTDLIIQQLEKFGALGADGKPTNLFVGTGGQLGFYEKGEQVPSIAPFLPQGVPPIIPHDVRFAPDLAYGLWIQYQGGEQKVIFPPNLATANFVLPPWLR